MSTVQRHLHTAATVLALTLAPLLGSGVAAAADETPPPHGKMRDRMVEKFDADGDGQLSEDERDKAREAWQRKRFDADNDGKLSDEEQAAAEAARAKHMGEFDKDGDGQLSEDERKAMWKSRREVMLDADGDGTVSEAERNAHDEMRKQHRAATLEKYDADHDGKLSPVEREAAFRDGHRRMGGAPGPGGPGADPTESPAP